MFFTKEDRKMLAYVADVMGRLEKDLGISKPSEKPSEHDASTAQKAISPREGFTRAGQKVPYGEAIKVTLRTFQNNPTLTMSIRDVMEKTNLDYSNAANSCSNLVKRGKLERRGAGSYRYAGAGKNAK